MDADEVQPHGSVVVAQEHDDLFHISHLTRSGTHHVISLSRKATVELGEWLIEVGASSELLQQNTG